MPARRTDLLHRAFLLAFQQPAQPPAPRGAALLAAGLAYDIAARARRAARRAERHPADRLPQQLPRHAAHLLASSLPQRLPPRLPLGRCRLRRRAPPVQRSQGSGLRLQPRARRADHGRSRWSRSIRSRPTAPSCASRCPAPLAAGRLDAPSRWAGTRGRPPCPRRQGRAGPALRLRPVVSQGRGLRPVRLGGASALCPRASSTASSAISPWTLDVPEDQVVGATGVPVCGDPGLGARQPRSRPPGRVPARRLRRADAVGRRLRRRGAGPQAASAGTPSDVHHFAMSLNPAYRYEGGRFGDVAVHVLYQPGDDSDLGRRRRGRAHRDGAGLARPALRPVRLAADHQRAPDRGRRHRVPDDDPRRLGRPGAHRPRAGPQLHHGHPRQQRMAGGLARRGLHQLPDQLVLRDDGRAASYAETEARDPAARPGRLVRADQPRERGVPRLHHLQLADLHPGRAVLPSAPGHRGRRDDAPDPPHLLRALEATSTWTRPRSGRWRRRCRSGTCPPSSPSGCTRPSCTTTRSARCRTADGAAATGGSTRVEVVRKAPGRFPVDVVVLAQADSAPWCATDGLRRAGVGRARDPDRARDRW